MKVKITQQLISGITSTGKSYTISDDGRGAIPGFHARVSAKGNVVFYQYYKTHSGERRNYKIGSAQDWTVSTARDKAQEVRVIVKKGGDPHGEKQAIKREELASSGRNFRNFLFGLYKDIELVKLKTGDQILKRVEAIALDAGIMEKDLLHIRAIDLEKWRARRLQAGIAVTTLNRDITAIRSVMKAAVRLLELEENPLKDLKHLKTDHDGRVRYLTSEERYRLDAVLNEDRTYMRALVYLVLNTGMRRGEVLSLLWSDINFNNGVITLRAEETKTSKSRHIPLNTQSRSVLAEWKSNRQLSGLVFPSPRTGQQIVSLAKAWENLMKKSQINDFRFHDMRHDFASQLVMKGADILSVSKLLGHASIQMTMRYAHLAPDHLKGAVALLDN
ncbi:MAG: site-specific integrase [Neptuniibacter sp.]